MPRSLLFRSWVLSVSALALAAASAAGAQTCDQGKVLRQMDAAAQKFQSAQAEFSWDQLQTVVQEHDIQAGTVFYDRRGTTTVMAADIKTENGQPAPKTVVYDGKELTLYQPGVNQETIFSAGNNRGQYESFLTLGFGGSGKDLEANWDVSCQGTENIAGVDTTKLDLKPKQQSVASTFSHVTIWIDPVRGISLKQIFYEPSGDNRTATYSSIKYNEKLDPAVFKIKAKPGVNIVRK